MANDKKGKGKKGAPAPPPPAKPAAKSPREGRRASVKSAKSDSGEPMEIPEPEITEEEKDPATKGTLVASIKLKQTIIAETVGKI